MESQNIAHSPFHAKERGKKQKKMDRLQRAEATHRIGFHEHRFSLGQKAVPFLTPYTADVFSPETWQHIDTRATQVAVQARLLEVLVFLLLQRKPVIIISNNYHSRVGMKGREAGPPHKIWHNPTLTP